MDAVSVFFLVLLPFNVIADSPAKRPPPAGFVAVAAPPSWIWCGPGAEKQTVFLRRTFEIKTSLSAARLVFAADDRATVYFDGLEVLEQDRWSEPGYKDLTALFQANGKDGVGKHTIAIKAHNERSAAGVLLRLSFEGGWTDPFALLSDGSWLAADSEQPNWEKPEFDDSKWSAASVLAGLGGKPWDKVTEPTLITAMRLREPTATPPERIKIAKDFKVELLYSVPKERQGSWVNLCTDPKGRLYVSDQYGPLYRITPPKIGGKPEDTKIEKVPVELGEAQGLLWAFDSLYVVVNKGNKYESGLYRVRDTNGDDQLDEVTLLRKLDGGGEHGPHAVILAPDGKSLFILCGNQTKMTELAGSRVPKHWGEDHLLQRMPDGRGFMAGVLGPGGCIYQVDPEGKNWTLYSTGFRNPFDIAFNREGELFTYDADMEWDISTPWYRPTRVCHVVSGSDWGWRNGAGKWPQYYPDTVPPVLDIGPGSPTGICFGYGAKFPAKYQDALFMCDWSYGKLYAVHLKPQGSSYTATAEEFLNGNPLPLTDVVINPVDGAMYFTIGGRKTKSGLYRVTYLGSGPEYVPVRDDFGIGRTGRRVLERLHVDVAKDMEWIWPGLEDPDRFIRSAARVALEHVDPKQWSERALNETDPAKALAALLALVRVSADDPQHHPNDCRTVDEALKNRLLESLGRIRWESLSESQRLEWLRIYQILFNRMGRPNESQRNQVVALLDPLYPAKSRFVNAMLCEILVYLEAPGVATKTLALLAAAPTQEEQIEYVKSLRVLKTGWTPEQRKEYFTWFRKSGGYSGGMSFGGFLNIMKKDAVATLTPTELDSLKSLIEAPPDPQPTPAQPPRPFVKKWAVADLDKAIAKGIAGRDFDRGRTLFAAGNCFACHRFANEGGIQGPDITMAAGRFSPRDLLESIIEPSKEISDQYASVVINTIDGKMIVGRIINLAGDSLTILPNMLEPNKLTTVDVRRIETQEVSKVSMMPEGLLDTFNEDEILDLLAYILSGGKRDGPMFNRK
jgi:putative heme-binding domain-containing protein